ncbi:type IV toxin-antitoxin system AbiEi family antitoxin domain-containing protein [Candidatus Thiothrix anitrata]|uniref:Type IV toxin-antitoxin system AbiEi family antitoxin domain-containing protein n=1 Tax=Candidatus Thiothrix anitrata TaxID=2823902 RepID=A0ABX7X6T3_9GAMM|nr:hypothetical protein [Candidatus Thiothrix anitrata]QTR50373.1 hypothetical protein J8380_01960 [Candidatus Thiothrix anitrata]
MRNAEVLLKPFGNIPLRHHTVLSVLNGYKTPNNKISRWLDEGVLLPLKRGMYVVSPEVSGKPIAHLLVANVLYDPSCVSLDYALWHYGLIPEAVFEVTSVTPRRSRQLDTGGGVLLITMFLRFCTLSVCSRLRRWVVAIACWRHLRKLCVSVCC